MLPVQKEILLWNKERRGIELSKVTMNYYVLKVNESTYLPGTRSVMRFVTGMASVALGLKSASLLIRAIEMFVLLPSTPTVDSEIFRLAGSFTAHLFMCGVLFLFSVFSDEYLKFRIKCIHYLFPAFFAWLFGCVGLVFGATANSSYFCLSVLGTLGGFSLIEQGAERFKFVKQMFAKSADEIMDQLKQRPITLYLRSFIIDEKDAPAYYSLDSREKRIMTWRVLNPMFWVERRELTFEEIICKGIGAKGPVVAIGRPGEPLPLLGAARKYLPNDNWQTEVLRLMNISDTVCIIPGFTESVSWELRQLFRLNNHKKILLVLEQNISWIEDWHKLRDILEKNTLIKFPEKLPEKPLAIAFTAKWEPVIFVGLPKISNYREIINRIKKL